MHQCQPHAMSFSGLHCILEENQGKFPVTEISLQEDEKQLLAIVESMEDGTMSPELAGIIKHLWKDPGIQACFERASEYQLNDSAA